MAVGEDDAAGCRDVEEGESRGLSDLCYGGRKLQTATVVVEGATKEKIVKEVKRGGANGTGAMLRALKRQPEESKSGLLFQAVMNEWRLA